MQDAPLISIALCTYNGERFLREQVDSLLAQDYPNLEVVAVDDASTDGTVAILEGYAARDRRLRVHRNASNLGFRRNFQKTIARCRGHFIAPSDQDDIWLPAKLRRLLEAMGEAPAAYCDSELIDERGCLLGIRLSDRRILGRIDDPVTLILQNCVSGHAMLFRRSLVARALPLPEGLFHDWWLALVAAGSGGVAYCPEPLVRYRQHGSSVTDIARLREVDRLAAPRGYRIAEFEATLARLQACLAAVPSRHRPLIEELVRLLKRWPVQYLCPRLGLLALHHRHTLFSLYRNQRSRRARIALKLLWGLRLKRLVSPHAYGARSSDAERQQPERADAWGQRP
ncbi:MAG TPA: glycosyltransferase family 2 protein [Anaeromyxobacteraceae bacterium]|nr:glycosyltransferase family 2 protein [Anaeromyxobacteraceae bacterium]